MKLQLSINGIVAVTTRDISPKQADERMKTWWNALGISVRRVRYKEGKKWMETLLLPPLNNIEVKQL